MEAALAGEIDVDALNTEEGVVPNAEIAAAVEESLARTNYGAELATRGITTVALDDDGRIIELGARRASGSGRKPIASVSCYRPPDRSESADQRLNLVVRTNSSRRCAVAVAVDEPEDSLRRRSSSGLLRQPPPARPRIS